ncbi:MAG: hypothetical protein ACR2OV_02775 [Hyphomicrobiaceae bacterium]
MTTDPDITEDVFNRVLAEPEALKVLEVLAAREGITTPFLEIPREKQFEIVAAMMEMARAAQEQADDDDPPDGATDDIPDNIVEQVFADPRADALLRDIMSKNELAGEPTDLPLEIKQAIVKMMVDQGIIRFGPQ